MAEIRSLLDLPAGAELPPRASVEDTLTSGYAYVLVLERDRLRIERELRALVRSTDRPKQGELAALSGRLAHADQELAAVRAMLASLRAQALS
jgi:alkylhydroperoxidase family enzyme